MLQDMWQLERDREKYEKQAKDSAGKHAEAIEQVELRELAIADIQKKVGCLNSAGMPAEAPRKETGLHGTVK